MSRAGRLVLVTGASSGIGRATAQAFAAEGDDVIAVARSRERLRELEGELGGPPRLVPIVADVTDAAAMDAMGERVRADHGTPDVIVANAGIGLDATFSRTTDEALRRVFAVNVYGAVHSVRPFVNGMVDRGSGRILFVSSIVGKRGTPHYSAYSGSKFALHGMADALRAELWGSGVTVGLICPSSTTTEFQDRLLREGPGQKRMRPRRHPPEAVARVIVRMAASRRREIIVGTEARLLWLADLIAPTLVDAFLARTLRPDK